jgi:hypothetical protein
MDDNLAQYQGLIELTQTTEDVVRLDEEIDLLLQCLYHIEGERLEETLEKLVRVRVAAEIRTLLQAHTNPSKQEIKFLLSNAYRTICSLPILQLTLAFEPSEFVINTISRWARQNLAAGIILDLSLDRSVLGGAIIMYHGKFYDYSLQKKLQVIFEKGDLSLGAKG